MRATALTNRANTQKAESPYRLLFSVLANSMVTDVYLHMSSHGKKQTQLHAHPRDKCQPTLIRRAPASATACWTGRRWIGATRATVVSAVVWFGGSRGSMG